MNLPHCPLPLLSLSSLPLQYEVAESSLLSRTLWLSVWDWDRFGKHQFLGEVLVALKKYDFSGTRPKMWYLLKDKVGDSWGLEDSTLYTRSCVLLAQSN